MYILKTYNDINNEEWRELVRESKTGTWFQTPEAYALFASMPNLLWPFAIAIVNEGNDDCKLRGVCVGYVTVEKNPIKQFFTRRAIILGGPAIADDATEEEVEALMKGVRKRLMNEDCRFKIGKGPIYIETRNFNDYSKWRDAFERAGFEYQPHLNFNVDCTDREKMLERLSENRKRQIRKGGRLKVNGERLSVIDDGVQEENIREWYGILEKLYRTKVKTPLWPVVFFLEAYRKNVGKFLLVKHNNHIIGGSMIVNDTKSVYEWFECGLNAEYKEQYPSVMATWAGMEYTNQHDIAQYDMMGAGEPNVPYGVRDFKAEFGGELVEHGRFICKNKPLLYKIGKLGVKLLKRYI